MSDDSVQFLSNISRTEWVSGSGRQEQVNDMLSQGWALLATGMNPYGEPTWLLGLSFADALIPSPLEEGSA